MAGPIRALGQVAMPAHDMDRAVAFYRDTLQLPFIGTDGQLAFFQLGTVRLLLEKPKSPAFAHPGSILYFDVEDIDSAVTDLQSRGVTFESPPHHIGDVGKVAVYMAFFPDSEGNLLALQSERPR